VPGMVTDVEVKVLWEPGRRDPSEVQGVHREVEAERSTERICGLTYRNRIGGVRGRASVHVTAKLLRPFPASVNPAVAQRRSVILPGEISPCARKGDVAQATEREVSRGRSSRAWETAKGRTRRRAKRP